MPTSDKRDQSRSEEERLRQEARLERIEESVAAAGERLDKLTDALNELASFELISRPLEHGLHEISEQLEPLRQLIPRTFGHRLPRDIIDALASLRASLVQPKWDGAGRIP